MNKSTYTGRNSYRVCVGKTIHHCTHAEIDSVYKFLSANRVNSLKGELSSSLRKKVSNSCMYIAHRNGTNSKPCEHCTLTLSKFHIKKIKYTNEIVIDGLRVKVLVEARLRS